MHADRPGVFPLSTRNIDFRKPISGRLHLAFRTLFYPNIHILMIHLQLPVFADRSRRLAPLGRFSVGERTPFWPRTTLFDRLDKSYSGFAVLKEVGCCVMEFSGGLPTLQCL